MVCTVGGAWVLGFFVVYLGIFCDFLQVLLLLLLFGLSFSFLFVWVFEGFVGFLLGFGFVFFVESRTQAPPDHNNLNFHSSFCTVCCIPGTQWGHLMFWE